MKIEIYFTYCPNSATDQFKISSYTKPLITEAVTRVLESKS